MRLIILSGLSGSGKSTAAHALEDEGFYVTDNLPPVLLPRFLATIEQSLAQSAAGVVVVVDIRSREFFREFEPVMAKLEESGCKAELVFFDADDEVLLRRYSETRRRHPLSATEGVQTGIERERILLASLRHRSSRVIDTSNLNSHQLRATVVNALCEQGARPVLPVRLQSFGFRYGLPPESDMVIDVRFLPNPHFDATLSPLTGLDSTVREYVTGSSQARDFMHHLRELLHFLLPQYQREGKSYLTVSIGCTGGRHRSVSIVETLRHELLAEGVLLEVFHRDVSRG